MRLNSFYNEFEEYFPKRFDFASKTNSSGKSGFGSNGRVLSPLENWFAGFVTSSPQWQRTGILFYILLAIGLGLTCSLPQSMNSHLVVLTSIMLTFGGIGLAFLLIDPVSMATRNLVDLDSALGESDGDAPTDEAHSKSNDSIFSTGDIDSLVTHEDTAFEDTTVEDTAQKEAAYENTAHSCHLIDFEEASIAKNGTSKPVVRSSKSDRREQQRQLLHT